MACDEVSVRHAAVVNRGQASAPDSGMVRGTCAPLRRRASVNARCAPATAAGCRGGGVSRRKELRVLGGDRPEGRSQFDHDPFSPPIDCSLKRSPAPIRYVDNGILPINNNMVENAIRPMTLGRRNCLFTGSEQAGCRAAAIQSLLATAKLNGLEPYAWLKDTLEKLPAWPYSRIDELLPLKITPAK